MSRKTASGPVPTKPDLRAIYEARAEGLPYRPGRTFLSGGRTARKYGELVKWLPRRTPGRSVELGCGNGPYIAYLSRQSGRGPLVATDLSLRTLVEARRRVESEGDPQGVFYVCCDMEALPFRSDRFDFVLCTQVIEHLLDDEGGLRELRRILRPGGRALISTDNEANRVSRALELPVRLAKWCLRRPPGGFAFPHRGYRPDAFVAMVRSAGLRVTRWETFRFSFPPPFWKLSPLVAVLDALERLLIRLPAVRRWGDIILVEGVRDD
ncbi:MAG: methyltransferase domain-containing protein [Nitrospinota bacterium]